MLESIETKGLNPWDLDRDNLVEADTSSHQQNRINYGPDFIATGDYYFLIQQGNIVIRVCPFELSDLNCGNTSQHLNRTRMRT